MKMLHVFNIYKSTIVNTSGGNRYKRNVLAISDHREPPQDQAARKPQSLSSSENDGFADITNR